MRDRGAREPAGRGSRPSIVLILVFLMLSAGIIAGGALTYLNYERQYRAQVEGQLSAIAELKVAELVQWRKERLGDAAVFLNDLPFIVLVRQMMDHPEDASLRARVTKLLDIIRSSYQYDRILVMNRRAEILESIPETTETMGTGGPQSLAEILATGRVTFLDLHRDAPDRPIHMALVVPLREEAAGAEPFGAIVLRVNPADYLYPFIRRWPTPSRTAETLLVRREGDEVLFLNDLRFHPGSALALRAPLTDKDLPAAAAVLGHVGIMNGKDYRGVPVLANVRPVPDSPWFLVARMDASEVFAPLKERFWLMIGLVAALLFGAAAAALGFWRQKMARSYREQYETEKKLRAVSARQDALYAAIPDIIMEVDSEKRYIWANRAGLAFFGEDVIGRAAEDYFEGEQETYDRVQPLFDGREDVIYVESWQRRKDGTKRLLAWWCRVLKDERGRVTGALSSGRDITEQKRAEEELSKKHLELRESVQQLERSRNLLNLIIESIPVRVFWKDQELRYLGCNSLFAHDAGFSRPQELFGKDDFAMGWKDQADLYRTDDRQVMESRRPKINLIEPQTTPTGATIWLSTSKVPLQKPDGEVIGVLGVYEDITERKRAADTLQESEEKFPTLFQTMPQGVLYQAVDGRILSANPAAERLLGLSLDQLLGRTSVDPRWRAIHEDGSDFPGETHPAMVALATGKEVRDVIMGIFNPQRNAYVWLNVNATPQFRPGESRPFQVFATFEDITERRQAAEALRKSEEKFRGLFDNMTEGVALHEIVYDDAGRAADYRILDVNPAFEKHVGVPLAAARGRLAGEIYGAPAPYLETYERVASTSRPADFEIYFEPLKRRFHVSAFSLGRGTFATVFEDITERRKAEEELRHSETFLGSVIDNSPLGMWVSDENGTMIKMNRALGKLLDVTPEELVGKYNVLQDDIVERQGYMPRVRAVFEKGETVRFPLVYDTAALRQLKFEGHASVILDVTISPVKGDGGEVKNAVIQLVDITERARAEEALRASLKEKEVLLREIHHRVKNNMQVISSLLNLQGAQVADPKIRDAFKESQIRIRSMALVHEKLYGSGDLSHIDFAAYLRKLYIHLGQAFAVASDRIGVRFDLEEISLDINSAIPCGLIATELIANAMKHAFPEERRGTIGVALNRVEGGRIRMTVSDDGVGFPPQIDFRMTDSLGMQIVNLLSQQIEGRIELCAGPGTSFSIVFPEALYKKRI